MEARHLRNDRDRNRICNSGQEIVLTNDDAPPIDLEALQVLVDGDPEFQSELIGDFLQCGRTTLADIMLAIQHEDMAAIQASAHSLKGASANLHAAVTCSLAEQLEMAAKSGDRSQLQEMADALSHELQRTTEYLGRWTV